MNCDFLKSIFFFSFSFRLQRVCQRQEYGIREKGSSLDSSGVALFEDYAIIDRRSKSFKLGHLVRLVCMGGSGPIEYKRPVEYDHAKSQSITAYFQFYDPVCHEGVTQRGIYEMKPSQPGSCPFKDILSHVNLSIVTNNNTFHIPTEELAAIEKEVATLLQPRQRNSRIERSATESSSHEGPSRRVLEGATTAGSDGEGPRRSTRRRTAFVLDT